MTSRDQWNRRYAEGNASREPSSFVTGLEEFLGTPGRALDVAGGAGRHALWLAKRGWDVTLVDVSDQALQLAGNAAEDRDLSLTCVRADLEEEPLPAGPWDLILCTHYLYRPLFPQITEALRPGGILAFAIATITNLEQHDRPPREYLLEEGEAPTVVPALEIVSYVEGWTDEGRHEARVVAVRR